MLEKVGSTINALPVRLKMKKRAVKRVAVVDRRRMVLLPKRQPFE
jgi:hypothetical protein